MDDSSDRDPMRRDSSRFEDVERAVRSVDESPSGSPGPETPTASTEESLLRTVGTAVTLAIGGITILVITLRVVFGIGNAAGLGFGAGFLISLASAQITGFFVLGTIYFRNRGFEPQDIRSYLGVSVPSLREIGVVIGGYITLITGIVIFTSIIVFLNLPEPAGNEGAEPFANNSELIPPGIVIMFLVVGPAEEFFFRGIIQNRLRERISVVPAVAAAGVIFAGAHLITLAPGATITTAAISIALLIPAGIVLGAVYEYTGNIIVPWLLHSINNSVILTLLLFDDTARESAGLLSTLL